jgi:hypothetical protein
VTAVDFIIKTRSSEDSSDIFISRWRNYGLISEQKNMWLFGCTLCGRIGAMETIKC